MWNVVFKVRLPKTKFPRRSGPQHDPAIQEARGFDKLYNWQQENNSADKVFTLHDGPPYANGDLHMGHLLNKVTKDIINRYKVMKGFRVHFRPGWDCHGLPIELKACRDMPPDATPIDIRQTAESFARKTIEFQKSAFKRWGIMADWDNPYITMSKEYESNQIDVFYQMYKQGCIHRGYKPVYWSPSSITALAEAELEYREHTSRSVYLLYKCHAPSLGCYSNDIHALVWTTTPWTLPANKAICYNPAHSYTLIKQSTSSKAILVGTGQLQTLRDVLGDYQVLGEFPGTVLSDCRYQDLFDGDTLRPFLPGDHVNSKEGTGLVHTAPAHGLEDYKIGTEHGLDLTCMVDQNGRYETGTGMGLDGMEVLGLGNETVIDRLTAEGSIIHVSEFNHRYPYDWRSKGPVIIRSTKQWFASVKSLRDRAIGVLNGVKSVPKPATNRLVKQLGGIDEWCISRQRVWGVPIPVFFSVEEGRGEEYLMNDESIDHIKDLFSRYGSDCWWTLPIDKLLPPSLCEGADRYRKGLDTMDVWFDSGSSWYSVSPGGVADVYLEGKDQYRGWFQSSLLTSVAVQDKSPFRQLVSHGFVLDGEGSKMSKSLGNILSPKDVMNEGGYEADTMRLWSVSSDFTSDVTISMDKLKVVNKMLRKIRSSLFFMLGNLSGFDPHSDLVPYHELPPLDQYQLHTLSRYYSQAEESFESFAFYRMCHFLMDFVRFQLSAFYFDIIKDRLYCDHVSGRGRLSTLTVLHHQLVYLLTSLGPILPHLVEEVAMYYPLEQGTLHYLKHCLFLNKMFSRVYLVTETSFICQPEIIVTACI